MRVWIIVIWLILHHVEFKLCLNDKKESIKVISEVVDEIFTRHGIDFDLTVNDKSSRIQEVFIAFAKYYEHPRKVKNLNHISESNGNALMFCGSLTSALDFFTQKSKTIFVFKKLNLTKVKNILANSANSVINPFTTSKQISEKFVLLETENSYKLGTFVYWTKKACKKNQFLWLNEFSKQTQKWFKPLEIKDKLNLFECPLNIISNVYQFITFDLVQSTGYSWIHPGIIPTLEKRDEKEREILKIFTKAYNVQLIGENTKNSVDLKMKTDNLFQERICSFSVFDINLKYMYSPPEPYTNYEKMILPFDNQIWLYLILVFCSAFIGIFIINQMPKGFRDLVYGKNVNMPSFNVIGTLFGIGQTKLPDNNFGRIILMAFIMFCLIFRTAYQGVFFDIFTNDIRRPPPKTSADLKERNYTIYNTKSGELTYESLFFTDSVDRPTVKDISVIEIFEIFKNISNPKLKAVIPTSENDLKVIKAFESFPQILNEQTNFQTQPICVERENFFASSSVEILNDLITGGIIQYWHDYLMNFELRPLLNPPKEPKVFEVDDLKFGFIVWLSACGISLAAFSIEIFYGLVKRNLIKFVKKYSGLIGLLTFFRD